VVALGGIYLIKELDGSINLDVNLSGGRVIIERRKFMFRLPLPTRWVGEHGVSEGGEVFKGGFEYYLMARLFVLILVIILSTLIYVSEFSFSGLAVLYLMIKSYSGVLFIMDFTNLSWERSLMNVLRADLSSCRVAKL
jgi:hypothetical protein